MTIPLANAEYIDELLKRIKKSRKSIVIVNYIAELKNRKKTNPIYQLSFELIKASKRGVKTDIVLEGSKLNQNYPFYRYLKNHNVNVWLDTSTTFIHQKTALIDGRCLIVASHNLSWNSLRQNSEFALATNDRKSISRFKETFKEITYQRNFIKSSVCRETIQLPASFLIKVEGQKCSGIATTLLTKHGKDLFDLYMVLCYEDCGRPRTLEVDYERWGKMMGLDPTKISPKATADYRKRFFYRRVGEALEKLDDDFGLITFNREKRGVKRRPLPKYSKKLDIPLTFWSYGWNRCLSFASKYFYLVSLYETSISPSRPWWRLSNKALSAKYKISKRPLERALPELTGYNLLEVLEAEPKRRGDYYYQEPNYYRHNPFLPNLSDRI